LTKLKLFAMIYILSTKTKSKNMNNPNQAPQFFDQDNTAHKEAMDATLQQADQHGSAELILPAPDAHATLSYEAPESSRLDKAKRIALGTVAAGAAVVALGLAGKSDVHSERQASTTPTPTEHLSHPFQNSARDEDGNIRLLPPR
jgi:ferric-dicitrate binding protein FerR (iron transport regulator)